MFLGAERPGMSDTAERCHQGKDFSLVIPLRGMTDLRALHASCRTLEVIYGFLGAERLGMGDTAERCHQGKDLSLVTPRSGVTRVINWTLPSAQAAGSL